MSDTIERIDKPLRIPTVNRKPRPKKLPRFIPVIFANGEDDDTPGILAAANNDAVQFGEKVYEPGDRVVVEGRVIVLRPREFDWALHAMIFGQEGQVEASRLWIVRCRIVRGLS